MGWCWIKAVRLEDTQILQLLVVPGHAAYASVGWQLKLIMDWGENLKETPMIGDQKPLFPADVPF